MRKNVKGGTLWGFLNIDSDAEYQKIEGAPFGDMEKICKKVSQSRNDISNKKFWSRARLEPTTSASQTSKNPD